jgi:phosphatidylinositol alpha-mannosyltransferase
MLRGKGEDVLVIGPGLPDGVPGVDLGPTATIPGNRSKAPISLDPRLGKVLQVVVAGLDVLHVHEPLMPAASLLALRAGPPVVATFHADPGPLVRLAYRAAGRSLVGLLGDRVRAVTAVSGTAASALPNSLDVTVIPNGVDTTGMRVAADRDKRSVVFLGRDEPRKGLDYLLKAWRGVVDAMPGAHLTVMGADRDVEAIEWLGHVDEQTKAKILNSAAVLVAPNTGGESFGIVLVEGMAAGTAVVASDIPAFRDVGSDVIRYFPVRDVAALTNTVLEVLNDDQERAAMSSRGIERAQRFDWGVVGNRYRSIYERVAS